MANIVSEYYKNYLKTEEKFSIFHNQIINMPRPTFREIPDIIKLMKCIVAYILLIPNEVLSKPTGPKIIYNEIYKNYKNNVLPTNNRSLNFEERYLNRNEGFEYLYSDAGKCGRMFRHYFALFTFFGYFNSEKIADIDSLNELNLTDEVFLFDVLRNRLLEINIKDNPFISKLVGININDDADYRPCRAILRYCNELSRKPTDFEIAILLGRIDEVQNENEIISRAVKIGQNMPDNRIEQEYFLFKSMGWINNSGEKFEYAQSQNPEFKFKTFLILMNAFDLIKYDYDRNSDNLIELTSYSKDLISNDIPIEVVDLQNLLVTIDNQSSDSNQLMDIILRKRTKTITSAIQNDGLLVEKLNKRNLHYPTIKNNKRVRSKLISEVAKIKANYLDEVTVTPSFIGKNGNNYVEAHHIIEFNGENGPDITDNLICLGPQNHSLIHHGSNTTVEDFYNTCKNRGILSFERFKGFVVKYQCLTKEHVNILVSKKIISSYDANELIMLIDQYGVDSLFLESLNTPTSDIV